MQMHWLHAELAVAHAYTSAALAVLRLIYQPVHLGQQLSSTHITQCHPSLSYLNVLLQASGYSHGFGYIVLAEQLDNHVVPCCAVLCCAAG
jgi:hypothetical protein